MLTYKPFDYKATVQDEGKGIVHAVVSVFGNVDSYGDVMVRGAFEKSIKAGKEKGKLPPGVWSHDWERPVAKTLDAWETDEGLHVIGQFNLETQDGRDAYSNVKNGLFNEYSFGFRRVKDGEEEKDGKNYVKDVEWYEWSPVLVGANRETYTAAVKMSQVDRILPLLQRMDADERALVFKMLDLPADPDPDPETPRLNAIKQISTLSDAEDTLRDAGFSRSESKAYISQIKSLLREAASDDQPEEKGEEPAGDSQSDASETPAEETETKQGDAVDPPAPIVTPPLATEDADTETSPYASEKSRWKREANAALYKEHLRITARIVADEARSLGVS